MNAEQAREKKIFGKKKISKISRNISRLKCCLEMSEARAFRGDARGGVGRARRSTSTLAVGVVVAKTGSEERKCVPGEGSADWGAWVVGVGVV